MKTLETLQKYRSIEDAMEERVLILDGAMGTMIQSYRLKEEDYRGYRFRNIQGQMMGNNDILSLTRPDVIKEIHCKYIKAGADVIEANTFSANRICMADYHCEDFVAEINRAAVKLAKEAVHQCSEDRQVYVIATIGPTNKSLSISPDVENPATRAITFDELCEAYTEQMEVLLREGVDGILLETIYDTLNCKAGIRAREIAEERTGVHVPLLLSVTLSNKQGRLLSGQTIEAFVQSVAHAKPLSIGLNCSFGAADMLPALRRLRECCNCHVSAHPNAGLPNEMGLYDVTPETFAEEIKPFLEEGLADIVGGCCGTTPEHISALVAQSKKSKCKIKDSRSRVPNTGFCGLEPMAGCRDEFNKIGERCNVAGSRKFLRLISEGNYDEALTIARKQVEDGAAILDVNVDDGLLDGVKEMTTFLNLMGSDPDICKVPFMIDSSNWEVISAGLKCIQGKCIVNSISLKEGKEVFVRHAREVMSMGAAVVVMAFDEQGQATSYERRIEICERAYRILTEEVGMEASDIIFDPNVLSVATGMAEHDGYAWDFIHATDWIRKNLPGAHVSGGISNLSFSFRGNNWIREAMHAVFLHEGAKVGLDFAIVNPSSKVKYKDIPEEELRIIEDVILRPCAEASERLISLAQRKLEEQEASKGIKKAPVQSAVATSVEERLIAALKSGLTDTLEEDLKEALEKFPHAVNIIEGPLMDGMNEVGRLFGEGKMFLPQVVKTARTMKAAVNIIQPYIEAEKIEGQASAGKMMVATVKGDVHDIGKNIVSVVMACNGYEIVDLGVMVPPEEIVKRALEEKPDIIGLSGLITPSLEEMVRTVHELREAGLNIPVMIGGATTSALHTALKIAPEYNGPVIWVKDASQNAPLAQRFLATELYDKAFEELKQEQSLLRKGCKEETITPIEEARKKAQKFF